MKTLTANLPDTIDPEYALWTLAHSLYEKGEVTLEEAASIVGLTPTYFMIRLKKPFNPSANQIKKELVESAKPLNRQKFDQLVSQLNIKESWEELVSQISK